MRRALMALLLVAGCHVSGDFDGTGFLCGDGRGCPAGYTCTAGTCLLPGAIDATIEPDGNVADAAIPDAAVADAAFDAAFDAAAPDAALPDAQLDCGEATLLTDDFDDGVAAAAWAPYSSPFTSVAETGGHLVATAADDRMGARYAGYTSVATYRLRESLVWVEVPVVTNTATTAQTRLRAIDAAGDGLAVVEQAGMLLAQQTIGGATTSVAAIAYSAVDHRFWRLSETAGTVSWETSPDGVAWTAFASGPSPALVDAVRLDVSAGTFEPALAPGAAEFESFNGGGAPIGTPCP